MGKRYEQLFHGKINVNVSSCIKEWSTALIIRIIQTKTTLRYQFLFLTWANYQMFAVCGKLDTFILYITVEKIILFLGKVSKN